MWLKYLSLFVPYLECKHLCFPPRKGTNRIKESTNIFNRGIVEALFPFRNSFQCRWLETTSLLKRKVTFCHNQETITEIKKSSVFTTVEFFSFSKTLAILRKKQKLAVVSRETQEITRNSQSQNTIVPGITEEYFAQVSEEIEGRATEKLSQELSRTKSRILGALCKLDEFLLNLQVRTFSGTVPGTSRNNDLENRELSQHVWEACDQTIPSAKDIPRPSNRY